MRGTQRPSDDLKEDRPDQPTLFFYTLLHTSGNDPSSGLLNASVRRELHQRTTRRRSHPPAKEGVNFTGGGVKLDAPPLQKGVK